MESKTAKTKENPNMSIFNQLETVPETAKTKIVEGRLKGKTSINTMWRVKRLTEVFGPCGIGWNFRIKETRTEEIPGGAKALYIDVAFKFKHPSTGEWSEEIHGTGGNLLVRNESKGLYLNDDAYKMALSDALSNAAKMLGLGGNIYYEHDQDNKHVSQAAAAEQRQSIPAANPVQAAYAADRGPSAKPEMNKLHPKWNYSIATIASSNHSSADLRRQIESMYTITDANFNELLRLAGRQVPAA